MPVLDLLITAQAALTQAIAEMRDNPPPGPVGEPKVVFALEWDNADGVPMRRVFGSIKLAEAQETVLRAMQDSRSVSKPVAAEGR